MRTSIKFLTALCLCFGFSVQMPAKDYLASEFGAKGDGVTLNTASLQAAIDFASANGGGRVVLTPGKYVSGSIYLKNDVTLHLEKDASILGSLNPWDYRQDPEARWTALVLAVRQKNIAITGSGVIDGRGFDVALRFVDFVHLGLIEDALSLDRVGETKRPENIHFYRCENVAIKDITLRDPACWTQQYDKCNKLLIEGIKVDATAYWNNDGLDVVDCSNVVIRNCYIDAADDAYCFKSHSADGVSENVLVEDCVGRSSANGIKFGTYTRGKFKNFRFRNMTIFDTYRSAFTIATVDGAAIEDIEIDGLKSLNTGNPIFLRTGTRNTREDAKPCLRNIVIRNVYAEVPFEKADAGYRYEGPVEDLPRNVCCSEILGVPGIPIENVLIENVEIVYPGKADPEYAYQGSSKAELESIDEQAARYPEFSNWKETPAWGFWVRHAEGIRFNNVTVRLKDKDYRPAFVFDDVRNISMRSVVIDSKTDSPKKVQIIRNNVKGFKKQK